MPTYPDYVYQTLAHAGDEGQWYCGQSDAATLCFDILALYPDSKEVSDLVYELFCDQWTIYDKFEIWEKGFPDDPALEAYEHTLAMIKAFTKLTTGLPRSGRKTRKRLN